MGMGAQGKEGIKGVLSNSLWWESMNVAFAPGTVPMIKRARLSVPLPLCYTSTAYGMPPSWIRRWGWEPLDRALGEGPSPEWKSRQWIKENIPSGFAETMLQVISTYVTSKRQDTELYSFESIIWIGIFLKNLIL